MIVFITIFVIVLFGLFYFLHQRVEDLGRKIGIIYSNIDVIHQNQEELLSQNLRMFHENKQKDRK
jgi:predicted Holliday junction resolvase-like endonuclease